ncbi:hypothetical protein [Actinocorallia sp. A-T 12471]|uniref:hypothetical protein n=1 Tax=Actinocorallia sp. A-T 12471 TaxID=3089813 RepID=UPI0029D183B3|nr:hypothetical protein [Actinocorallia sp. A-T 12471]MDX6738174.1 hypothetical protein [Actinocorallia sp. A-T 12471]
MAWGPGEPRRDDPFGKAERAVRDAVAAGWWPSARPGQREHALAGQVVELPDGTQWLFGAWARWYRKHPGDTQWYLCPPPYAKQVRRAGKQAPPASPPPPHVVPLGPDFTAAGPVALPLFGSDLGALTAPVRATLESAASLNAQDHPLPENPPRWLADFAPTVPSTVAACWGTALWCAASPVFDAREDAKLLGLWDPYRANPLPRIEGPRWLTPPTLEELAALYVERLRAHRVEAAVVVLRTMWATASVLREEPRFAARAEALLAILGSTLADPQVDYGALPHGDAAVAQLWITRCPPHLTAALRMESSPGDGFRHAFYDFSQTLVAAAGDPGDAAFVEPRLIAASLLAAELSVIRQDVVQEVSRWLDPELRFTVQAMVGQPGHPLRRRFWPEANRLPEQLRAGTAANREEVLAALYSLDLAWCRLGGGIPARPRGFPAAIAVLAEHIGPDRATATTPPPASPSWPSQPSGTGQSAQPSQQAAQWGPQAAAAHAGQAAQGDPAQAAQQATPWGPQGDPAQAGQQAAQQSTPWSPQGDPAQPGQQGTPWGPQGGAAHAGQQPAQGDPAQPGQQAAQHQGTPWGPQGDAAQGGPWGPQADPAQPGQQGAQWGPQGDAAQAGQQGGPRGPQGDAAQGGQQGAWGPQGDAAQAGQQGGQWGPQGDGAQGGQQGAQWGPQGEAAQQGGPWGPQGEGAQGAQQGSPEQQAQWAAEQAAVRRRAAAQRGPTAEEFAQNAGKAFEKAWGKARRLGGKLLGGGTPAAQPDAYTTGPVGFDSPDGPSQPPVPTPQAASRPTPAAPEHGTRIMSETMVGDFLDFAPVPSRPVRDIAPPPEGPPEAATVTRRGVTFVYDPRDDAEAFLDALPAPTFAADSTQVYRAPTPDAPLTMLDQNLATLLNEPRPEAHPPTPPSDPPRTMVAPPGAFAPTDPTQNDPPRTMVAPPGAFAPNDPAQNAQNNPPRTMVAPPGAFGLDVTPPDTPTQDTPNPNTPGHSGPAPGTPGQGGSASGTPGHGGSAPGTPGHSGASSGAPGQGGSASGTPGHGGSASGAPGHGGASSGAPGQGGAYQGTSGESVRNPGGQPHGTPAQGQQGVQGQGGQGQGQGQQGQGGQGQGQGGQGQQGQGGQGFDPQATMLDQGGRTRTPEPFDPHATMVDSRARRPVDPQSTMLDRGGRPEPSSNDPQSTMLDQNARTNQPAHGNQPAQGSHGNHPAQPGQGNQPAHGAHGGQSGQGGPSGPGGQPAHGGHGNQPAQGGSGNQPAKGGSGGQSGQAGPSGPGGQLVQGGHGGQPAQGGQVGQGGPGGQPGQGGQGFDAQATMLDMGGARGGGPQATMLDGGAPATRMETAYTGPVAVSVLLVGTPHTGQRRFARMISQIVSDGALEVRDAEELRGLALERLATLFDPGGSAVLLERLDVALLDANDPAVFLRTLRTVRARARTPLIATCDPRSYRRIAEEHPELERVFRVYKLPELRDIEERTTLLRVLADERRASLDTVAWSAVREDLVRLRGPGDLTAARLVETYLERAYNRALGRGGGAQERLVLQAADFSGVAESIEPALHPGGDVDGYLDILADMVGLTSAKAEVERLAREADGPLNLIFEGPPGTGKATVAGLLAGIFGALGVLPSGHLIQCRPEHIIGRDSLETELRTAGIVRQAEGGVLLVQKADGLTPEAVAELFRGLREHPYMLVLAATDIDPFLTANPDIAATFERVDFEAPTDRELVQLFVKLAEKKLYMVDEELRLELMTRFARFRDNDEFVFGRTVHTWFDETVARQARRISSLTGADALTVARLTTRDLPESGLERLLGNLHQTHPPTPQ